VPRRTPSRSPLLAVLLVVAVAVGIWLLAGRDPGTPTGASDATESAPADADWSMGWSDDPDPSGDTDAFDPESGLPWVDAAALPAEARDVLTLIDAGGPFPYEQDDQTFGNYEGLLPEHETGYYREYTVDTPGSDDRGARRIIAGSDGERYWTADHYTSFERIRT
jgi:ribonuclease T1